MAIDLKVKKLQTALFVRNLDLSQKLKVAEEFNEKVDNFFNGDPMILPLPEDFAPDAPRIVLKNSDGLFSCNVSSVRVDLLYHAKTMPDKKIAEIRENYIKILLPLVELLNTTYHATIYRIGFVPTFFTILDDSANDFLRTTFIREPYFENPYELGINVLHKFSLPDWEVNRWLRMYGLRKVDDPKDDRALEIIVDINTLQETNYDFNSASVRSFIDIGLKSVEDVLQKYLKAGV